MPASPKPQRGEYEKERNRKKRNMEKEEARIMADARTRDNHTCRFPGCQYRDLPVDVAHLQHRGMGGNPSLSRTYKDGLISLCRRHHQLFDQKFLTIKAIGLYGASTVCEFWDRQPWNEEHIYRGQS